MSMGDNDYLEVDSEGCPEYKVERILDKKVDDNGRIYYLVKWEEYSEIDSTWEPEEVLDECQDVIQEFEERCGLEAEP